MHILCARFLLAFSVGLMLVGVTTTQISSQSSGTGTVLPLSKTLAIVTTALPDATVGEAYSFQLVASGGKAPYAWEISLGRLPLGLTMDRNGKISGKPERATKLSASFTVTAKDTAGKTASKALGLRVLPPSTNIELQDIFQTVGASGDSCALTSDGGMIFASVAQSVSYGDTVIDVDGVTEVIPCGNFFLMKTDATGNPEWLCRLYGTQFVSVAADMIGNIYVSTLTMALGAYSAPPGSWLAGKRQGEVVLNDTYLYKWQVVALGTNGSVRWISTISESATNSYAVRGISARRSGGVCFGGWGTHYAPGLTIAPGTSHQIVVPVGMGYLSALGMLDADGSYVWVRSILGQDEVPGAFPRMNINSVSANDEIVAICGSFSGTPTLAPESPEISTLNGPVSDFADFFIAVYDSRTGGFHWACQLHYEDEWQEEFGTVDVAQNGELSFICTVQPYTEALFRNSNTGNVSTFQGPATDSPWGVGTVLGRFSSTGEFRRIGDYNFGIGSDTICNLYEVRMHSNGFYVATGGAVFPDGTYSYFVATLTASGTLVDTWALGGSILSFSVVPLTDDSARLVITYREEITIAIGEPNAQSFELPYEFSNIGGYTAGTLYGTLALNGSTPPDVLTDTRALR